MCHENADCFNEPGTYSCECKEGFVGDGVDECDGIMFIFVQIAMIYFFAFKILKKVK